MAKTISRYRVSVGDEGLYEPSPHGRVLKNLLQIKSKREMDRIENEALEQGEDRFTRVITTTSTITIDLLLNVHKCIFFERFTIGVEGTDALED